MKRGGLLLAVALPALALTLAAPLPAQPSDGPPRRAYANPSAGIAADIAFSRLAQQKGRWAAFRETAADDAVMFAPQMVLARAWLKDRAEPPKPLGWQPHAAWSSCDGSLIVTSGAWQSGAEQGWYTTIWQRQPKKGEYKWVFDHGGPLEQALAAPDMLSAKVAECPPRRAAPASAPSGAEPPKRGKPVPTVFDPARRSGASSDGSLVWDVSVAPDGARHFVARMRSDGEMRAIRDERVPAPGG